MYSSIIASSQDEFVHKSVDWLEERIRGAVSKRGECVLGLSGGTTPKDIYTALAKRHSIPWSNVILFLVDERYIAHDQKDANTKLLKDSGLLSLPLKQVVIPKTDLSLCDCIADYDARIGELTKKAPFDVLTLGLGDDGHIASLFPPLAQTQLTSYQAAIHTTTDKFAVRDRITVTLEHLSNAQAIVFFLKGEAKMNVWSTMMSSAVDALRWPAHQVLTHGKTTLITLK